MRNCTNGWVANNTACNDSNQNINPGATEQCNGLDDDCDGQTDNGCACISNATFVQSQQCYSSTGGGTPGVGVCQWGIQYCTPEGQWGPCEGAVYPAQEVCNGLDDDCDNVGDLIPGEAICTDIQTCQATQVGGQTVYACRCPEGYGSVAVDGQTLCMPLRMWYADTDGDGYGDLNNPSSLSAIPPPGYVNDSTDCDDGNENVNPGAAEDCTDMLDNNCDGVINNAELCSAFECGNVFCQGSTYTDSITRRNGLTCKNERVDRSVVNNTPVCHEDTYCTYTQTITELSRTNVSNVADGLTCNEGSEGYCLNGACLPPCPPTIDQPGCRATAPPNALHDATHACTNGICYRCPDSMIWNERQVRCEETQYSIELDGLITTAGETVTLTPVVKNNRGSTQPAVFRYSGYKTGETSSPFTFTTKTSEVGSHELVVTAVKYGIFGEKTLARTAVDIVLTCPQGMACCIPGKGTTSVFIDETLRRAAGLRADEVVRSAMFPRPGVLVVGAIDHVECRTAPHQCWQGLDIDLGQRRDTDPG